MSQDRVEVVRSLIELWNTGHRDLVDLPEYLDPAIELESPFSSVIGEPYRGYAGIKQWVRDIDEQFAEWSIVLDDVRQIGDQVISIATINARGRASDITLHFPSAAVLNFASNHRVTHMRLYTDVEQALKAVGLEG